MTIPSPSMLHLRGGRAAISREVYPDLDAFWSDVAAAYRQAIGHLYDAGCRYLQLDDITFAYLCDPQIQAKCRANGDDPAALPATYARVINAALSAKPADLRVTIHTCRGNFKSAWVAEGGYDPVVQAMFSTDVDGYFMEFDSARAGTFEPLKALNGRVFACLGNHDHESLDTVAGALRDIGATLLVDEERTVETPAGPVQILGMDFHFRDRASRMKRIFQRYPRLPGHKRIVLLHDPGAFRHVPDGEADLVFGGHTHGGQLGLLVFGLPHTFVSAFTEIPDHGLWALGRNRLYVHRGTGHYGFPLRVGVPGEESVLRVHWAENA